MHDLRPPGPFLVGKSRHRGNPRMLPRVHPAGLEARTDQRLTGARSVRRMGMSFLRRLQQQAHLRPRVGLEFVVAVMLGFGQPALDRLGKCRPLLDALIPARHARAIIP